MSEEYNGWKNYETWSIALFIDNEQPYYNHVMQLNKMCPDDYDFMTDLKNYVENFMMKGQLTIYQEQAIQGFLAEVDYIEIIKHYREETK